MAEEIKKIPSMELGQCKYLLSLPEDVVSDKNKIRKRALDIIEEKAMAPYYEWLCAEMNWEVDTHFLERLRQVNTERLSQITAQIEDAEKNLGESEIKDAFTLRAEYLTEIGDKEKALTAFRLAYEKTASLGPRLDLVLYQIRIGLFYADGDLTRRNIEKAQSLLEEGGDWDRRNRLKIYEGVYMMTIRNFKRAAELFLDTLATFTSTELMDYKTFVRYALLMSVISLDRPKIKEKVVNAPEILEYISELPDTGLLVTSLYNCDYRQFFLSLAQVEVSLKTDLFLHAHTQFFVREMRIIAYSQLLESYQSLTLRNMAISFGVSEDFIDRDVSRFIAAGRLNCTIDKVAGVLLTNRPDTKNAQYQLLIKQGDVLLNKVQKLSRVINL